jgi:DUF4097 and DUF4098 domain-containing protein YvlB
MILTVGRVTALSIGIPIILGLTIFGAFNVVGIFAQTSEHHGASYTWHGGAISVNTSSGNVRIVRGTGTQIAVEYTEHYQLKKPTVSAATSNGGVQLIAKCPSGIFDNNCAINYVVTIPGTVSLILHSGSGDLDASGVAGRASFSTGSGDITFSDLSGPIVAHTGSGAISGTRTSSKDVQATTGAGDVHVEWVVGPTAVVIDTGVGDISLVVPRGSGPYRTTTQTGVGSADVTVATDRSANPSISARTGVGSISIGFPRN